MVEGGGNGVGGDGGASPARLLHVTQDHGLEHDRPAEKEGGQQEGSYQLQVVPRQHLVPGKEITDAPGKLFVDAEYVDHDHNQLHDPRRQGGDGRSRDTQAGEAPAALDEEIVETAVDQQGRDRDPEADAHRFHTAQHRKQEVGEGEDQEGILHDPQVLHPCGVDGGIVGEEGDHGGGGDGRDREEREGEERAQKECAHGNALDGFGALLPPVLAAQHHGGIPRPQHELLEEELHLIDRADACHGGLTVGADHDVVQEVDTQGNDIVEDQHRPDGEKGLIEGAILDELKLFHEFVFPLRKKRGRREKRRPRCDGRSVLQHVEVIEEHDHDTARGVDIHQAGGQIGYQLHEGQLAHEAQKHAENSGGHHVNNDSNHQIRHRTRETEGQGKNLLQDIHDNILLR